MDFDDSPAEAAFRSLARSWLSQHIAAEPEAGRALSPIQAIDDRPEAIERAREWQHQLADARLAAVAWPREYGGRGRGPLEAMVLDEELTRVGISVQPFTIGLAMIGPTIIACGSNEQKRRYLPPMIRGDEIWCQLWSEPDAGSDLAGVRARAEIRDGVIVLNGQKIWTSGAHYSHFGLGVFRSDFDLPKHKGITTIIVPMDSPGVSTRRLNQIDGGSHFNEVHLDEVRLPVDCVLGDWNDGWRVARTMMLHERLTAGGLASLSCAVPSLFRLARASKGQFGSPADDQRVRQRLAHVFVLARLVDLTAARVRTSLARDSSPGPEASILKLLAARVGTEFAEAGVDVLGAAGALWGDGAPQGGRWAGALVESLAMHIAGGTDEIQRNIIAETILGLPRDVAPDRDAPFRSLQPRPRADQPHRD